MVAVAISTQQQQAQCPLMPRSLSSARIGRGSFSSFSVRWTYRTRHCLQAQKLHRPLLRLTYISLLESMSRLSMDTAWFKTNSKDYYRTETTRPVQIVPRFHYLFSGRMMGPVALNASLSASSTRINSKRRPTILLCFSPTIVSSSSRSKRYYCAPHRFSCHPIGKSWDFYRVSIRAYPSARPEMCHVHHHAKRCSL